MHALRTDRYKYIHYYGIWDSDELYDLQEDPQETTNLIYNPERKETIAEFNKRLFDEMERTDGMSIPLFRDSGGVNNKRNAKKGKAADFPEEMKVKK
jgi:N-acetylglucosamine-6-sulfatase